MLLDEFAGSLLRFVWGLIADFVVGVLFEIVVKVPGYFLAKVLFGMKKPDAEGWRVILLGVLFWALAGYSIYLIYQYF